MIENFFQSLEANQVDYLLISGQATVLYGAATFSEDLDIWIKPDDGNCKRFIASLREVNARYYKLTPPLEVDYLNIGHGFHFTLPLEETGEKVFLDVLGKPPRVKEFDISVTLSNRLFTDWGKIPTIGLKDLVELKKTQRIADYPIISNLALIYCQNLESSLSQQDFDWIISNIFTSEILLAFLTTYPKVVDAYKSLLDPVVKRFVDECDELGEIRDSTTDQVEESMQKRMRALQKLDRHYWRAIIKDLKNLNSNTLLVPIGQPV